MRRPVLRTERIELRPMRPEHLPLLHTLDTDPEVMRYLTGRARTPQEIDQFWGPTCADLTADRLGLGWWVGFLRAGPGAPSVTQPEEFLGWWGLSPSMDWRSRNTSGDAGSLDGGGRAAADRNDLTSHPEAGWRLASSYWRQGYASEGARALLAHAFETLEVLSVWAETMAVNQGSRGVMRKVGMRHVETYHASFEDPLPETDKGEVIYEITSDTWPRT